MLAGAGTDYARRIGVELAKGDFPLVFELIGLTQSKEGLFSFMKEILSNCWHWFDYVEQSSSRDLMLYHEYGANWSAFLKSYLSQAFLSIGKAQPDIAEEDKLVRIGFKVDAF